jgi:hypothetical protein
MPITIRTAETSSIVVAAFSPAGLKGPDMYMPKRDVAATKSAVPPITSSAIDRRNTRFPIGVLSRARTVILHF